MLCTSCGSLQTFGWKTSAKAEPNGATPVIEDGVEAVSGVAQDENGLQRRLYEFHQRWQQRLLFLALGEPKPTNIWYSLWIEELV